MRLKYLMGLTFLWLLFNSCTKELDVKPSATLATPETLKDLQAVLDASNLLNFLSPAAGEMSSDDYFLNNTDFNAINNEGYRRTYLWEKDLLFSNGTNDWSMVYRWIYYANTCLENIEKIPVTNENRFEWNNTKGQAYWWRAHGFMKAATIWSLAYDPATATKDLGIPLRTGTDFNEVSTRSTVFATYQQIISDLKAAIPLLPVTPVHVMRPSKPVAYALLARTFLWMRDYEQAGKYADSCLQLKNTLLDYNTLNAANTYPVPQFNVEVLFHSIIQPPNPLSNTIQKIDSNLYRSYAINDLRRSIFFKPAGTGMVAFFGSYDANGTVFSGVATDELYLIRAECAARRNDVTSAMNDLNTLLIKRWKTGTFTPLTATSGADALNKVLIERRKELLMRDLRWMDIKRLNKEGANIGLTRIINGQTYTLPPNDLRFALAIPEDVIALSGMPQNPR